MKIRIYICAAESQREAAEEIRSYVGSNGLAVVQDISECNVLLFVQYGSDSREEISERLADLEYAKSAGIKIIPLLLGKADKNWYEKAYGALNSLFLENPSDLPLLGQVFDMLLPKGRNEKLYKQTDSPAVTKDEEKRAARPERSMKDTGEHEGWPLSSSDCDTYRESGGDYRLGRSDSDEYEEAAPGSVDRDEYEEAGGYEEAARGPVDCEEYEESGDVNYGSVGAGSRGSVDREQYEESVPTTQHKANGGSGKAAEDDVQCTLFAPDATKPGRDILIEVFAHLAEDSVEVESIAKERDDAVRKQMAGKLKKEIARGSTLVFELRMGELQKEIDEPIQDYVWDGEIIEVPFVVNVPYDFAPGVERGKVIVSVDGAPVGRLIFKVEIGEAAEESSSRVPSELKRYRKAFISYSSKDRPEVLRRVHMLDINGIDYFQDVLSLDPGQRWEQKLYEHIDSCDVVFVFWSTDASKSQWIAKELVYAEEHRKANSEGDPDIIPIIIEGPPPAPAPKELSFLQFNDKMAYVISGADQEAEILREREKSQ